MKVAFFLSSLPEDELEQRQFPLGVGYLAALLKEGGVEVLITSILSKLLSFHPDVVGISSVSQCFNQAKQAAATVKECLDVPVVLGGYHISALPHTLPSGCDVGVIGEGEIPFLRLVELLCRAARWTPQDLAEINGICFRDDAGRVMVNRLPHEVQDLDALPFPWRNVPHGYRPLWFFSARGCVYKCQFCASSRHWGHYRPHSAEYVVNEIESLVTGREATYVEFLDDLFFADKKRLCRISDLLNRRGLSGKVAFHGFITSNLATREVMETAKAMGFRSIRFGVETGSDRLLKEMKGPWASVENHQRCIDLANEFGIQIFASFMFGTPGETEEDLESTYRFLKRNRGCLNIAGFYLTTPVPGTPYWDFALRKGLVSEDMDWSRLNLDFLKTLSFDFNKNIYLNEDLVPHARFRDLVARIGEEFLNPNCAALLRTTLAKGTTASTPLGALENQP